MGNQTHRPASLDIQFSGGNTQEAVDAIKPVLDEYSESLARVDAPLSTPERGLIGTFILWFLDEYKGCDEPLLNITRTLDEENEELVSTEK